MKTNIYLRFLIGNMLIWNLPAIADESRVHRAESRSETRLVQEDSNDWKSVLQLVAANQAQRDSRLEENYQKQKAIQDEIAHLKSEISRLITVGAIQGVGPRPARGTGQWYKVKMDQAAAYMVEHQGRLKTAHDATANHLLGGHRPEPGRAYMGNYDQKGFGVGYDIENEQMINANIELQAMAGLVSSKQTLEELRTFHNEVKAKSDSVQGSFNRLKLRYETAKIIFGRSGGGEIVSIMDAELP